MECRHCGDSYIPETCPVCGEVLDKGLCGGCAADPLLCGCRQSRSHGPRWPLGGAAFCAAPGERFSMPMQTCPTAFSRRSAPGAPVKPAK